MSPRRPMRFPAMCRRKMYWLCWRFFAARKADYDRRPADRQTGIRRPADRRTGLPAVSGLPSQMMERYFFANEIDAKRDIGFVPDAVKQHAAGVAIGLQLLKKVIIIDDAHARGSKGDLFGRHDIFAVREDDIPAKVVEGFFQGRAHICRVSRCPGEINWHNP